MNRTQSIGQKLKAGDTAFAGAVGAVIGVLVTIVVGILIFYKISGSINGLPADGVIAAQNVNVTANTVFTLAPIDTLWS